MRVDIDMALLIKYTITAGPANQKRIFNSIQLASLILLKNGSWISESTFLSFDLDS
ncbi:hypothetical protein HYC85_006710 [Camellia sinensis]|uniref:Uncharacterized protein n=1 Tax=Camellia sinensis TaxID=4442 RepID=A0A7J7HPC9_CAMSI|nr:hypothetical protein HYC85_006710 [Camellia sinensis]